jgi:hypothetical protein
MEPASPDPGRFAQRAMTLGRRRDFLPLAQPSATS